MADLPNVSNSSIDEFTTHSEEIIQSAVRESMAYKNEIAHHGKDAHRMVQSGVEWTYKMLKGAISAGESQLLDDQAKWSVSRLPHDNVSLDYLVNRLKRLQRSMQQVLSKQAAEEISPYFDYLIERIKHYRNGE